MEGGDSPFSSLSNIGEEKMPLLTWKDGLRLVDLYELAKQMHCKTCASLLDLNDTQSETRWGFGSVLSVLCGQCQILNDIYTGKINETVEGKTVFEVNVKASVNMLLCGAGGRHVFNFLAMLNVPEPTLEGASLTLPSPVESPGSSQAWSPGNDPPGAAARASSVSPPTVSEVTLLNSVHDLPVTTDVIKREDGAETSENDKKADGLRICSPESAGENDGCERDGEDVAAGNGDMNVTAMKSGREGAEGSEGVCFGDGCEEEERVERPVGQKRYRCPLCEKVLPSSRGFHVHVGRKHQVSNLQALKYELGPDDAAQGDKGLRSVGEQTASAQLSQYSHSSPTRSLLFPSHAQKTNPTTGNSCTSQPATSTEGGENPAAGTGTRPGHREGATKAGRRSKRVSVQKAEKDSGVLRQIADGGRTFQSEPPHQKQKGLGAKPPFACVQCPKQYQSQKSLNIHVTVAHCSKDERKAVCKYCGDTVPHRRALKRHIKAVHPRGAKKTFYCDECPLTFRQPSALKNHKLKHSGVKNYQCFYCDKRFSGSGNRLNHMRYFHEKERKFLCDTCGAGFYRAYSLREHERVHSGEKPYQCERCAERFTKKEYLTIHMRTHTGERPYKCELCDKAFTQRTSRSLHRRKVHGLKKQEPAGGACQKEVQVGNKTVFVST